MSWLRRMMYGRYGGDQLSWILLIVYVVLLLLSGLPHLGILSWVALLVLAWSFFRMFSRTRSGSVRISLMSIISVPPLIGAATNKKSVPYFVVWDGFLRVATQFAGKARPLVCAVTGAPAGSSPVARKAEQLVLRAGLHRPPALWMRMGPAASFVSANGSI